MKAALTRRPVMSRLKEIHMVGRAQAERPGHRGRAAIDLTLTFLRQSVRKARRHRRATVRLGLPARPGAREEPRP